MSVNGHQDFPYLGYINTKWLSELVGKVIVEAFFSFQVKFLP
mgnify:FL=1